MNCRLVDAEREYRLAEELGEPAAGYRLGAFMLDHGDEDEAADVLERAASCGDLDAYSTPSSRSSSIRERTVISC
ncbi:hypothetical protein FXN61_13705 [Lentzea sp. PSKA42]|uniref:Tetratricopeptide repeat-containing protein n=1 Tax=Lentzea indica TaxID=2604800 RepID=A0ABX1FGF4_9PSEU|nr:hypothetical protein [Lentzea indica]NKE57829.1 hypothetical protein [Lentzea indica]